MSDQPEPAATEHPLSTPNIEEALTAEISVPAQCTCAYVRHAPYHLIERKANPACPVADHGDTGELEKERD